MGLGKFLDPKNDYAFKRIFGTEKNKDILIHFLNDMIPFPDGGKIETATFLKTSQDPDIAARKQSIVDVLCVDEKGRRYIVEMQVANTRGFEKRAQYYAAKAYVDQMHSGDAYHELKEVIFLAITDFVMFPESIDYKTDHVTLNIKTMTHNLKDFYYCFLELPKFNKSISELSNLVEKWTYFFKHASNTSPEDLKKIVGADQILEKAYEGLNQFFWSSQELSAYEEELKRRRDEKAVYEQKDLEGEQKGIVKGEAIGFVKGEAVGFVKGKEEGRAEGAQDAKLQIAKQLLDKGVSIDTIQTAAGLLPEEIDALIGVPK